MKNIKIDGKNYQVQDNITVLKACESAGIDIPTLCFVEGISEEASCSICMVEVKNAKTLLRSCVTKVTEGMEIFTGTPRVMEARKMNLELILANHPLDCMTCDRDGDCLLQDLAYKFEIKKSRFLSLNKVSGLKQETSWDTNPFIQFDPDKCILCARCVNTCANQAVTEAICISMRGHSSAVSTPFNDPLEKTICQFCAECVQSCPVGALIEKPRIGKGKIKDLIQTDTVCAYCGVGCNLKLYRDKKNNLVLANGKEGNKINNGRICVKGKFGYEYVNSPDRLTKPLIRENGEFKETTWDEAIKYTAKRLKEIKEKYGPDSIGVLGSSKCTNEDNYLVQKFARAVLGTNNVDNCARLCHSSTVVGLGISFGAGAATNSINDIKDSDVMFVIGSNMAETHPVIAQIVKEHQKNNKAKLIVCDPRYVGLAKYADVFIQHTPGTDVALLNGIMNVILTEGIENRDFIEQHTEGLEEVKKVILKYDLETVSKITNVDKDIIRQAGLIIGKAENMMIFFTMGITQHTTGVDNVLSVANLNMLTGNVGRLGVGVMPLRGQANVQGACDMGVLPNVFTGYRKVDDPAVREKFENDWGVKLPDKPGSPVTEFAGKSLKGEMKAVYAMGENPLMTEADISHVKEGFEKLEFLAIQDIFLSETAKLADVVFPAAATYEKDGTFTNTDRTVQLLRPARIKPEGTKFDWEIVREVSKAMGYEMKYKSSAEIMEEIAEGTPSYCGIRHKRLEKNGLQWPCTDENHQGTEILHKGGIFKTSSGKGIFSAVEYKQAQELPDEEYPFILTTGRILFHYHSGNETRRVKVLDAFVPKNYVEINPEDAKKMGIKDNNLVRVSTRRGSIELNARISEQPKEGVIFIPFHFREASANVLTNPALDPKSKIPEFKVCSAKIEKV